LQDSLRIHRNLETQEDENPCNPPEIL